MNPTSLFTNNLIYFIAVYRAGNYSKAAAAIPISVQGLHKSIATLEKALGAPLFDSVGNGMVNPTPQGKELYTSAVSWLGDIKDLEDTFDALLESSQIVIHLLTARGVLGFLGFDIAQVFSNKFPAYRLDIVEEYDFLIEEFILERLYNIAISTPPQDDSLDFSLLGADGACIWVRKDHPLATRESVEMKDLDGYPVAVAAMKNLANEFFSDKFEKEGIKPRPFIRTTDLFYNFIYAFDGKTVGIGLSWLGKKLEAVENIASIPLIDGYEWKFGLVTRKGYELSKEETAFLEFLRDRLNRIDH